MPSETHRLEDTAMKQVAVVPVIGELMGQADGWVGGALRKQRYLPLPLKWLH